MTPSLLLLAHSTATTVHFHTRPIDYPSAGQAGQHAISRGTTNRCHVTCGGCGGCGGDVGVAPGLGWAGVLYSIQDCSACIPREAAAAGLTLRCWNEAAERKDSSDGADRNHASVTTSPLSASSPSALGPFAISLVLRGEEKWAQIGTGHDRAVAVAGSGSECVVPRRSFTASVQIGSHRLPPPPSHRANVYPQTNRPQLRRIWLARNHWLFSSGHLGVRHIAVPPRPPQLKMCAVVGVRRPTRGGVLYLRETALHCYQLDADVLVRVGRWAGNGKATPQGPQL